MRTNVLNEDGFWRSPEWTYRVQSTEFQLFNFQLWCLGKPMFFLKATWKLRAQLTFAELPDFKLHCLSCENYGQRWDLCPVCAASLRSHLQRLSWKHECIPLEPWFRANTNDDLNIMDQSSGPLSSGIETLHDNPRNPPKSTFGHVFRLSTLYTIVLFVYAPTYYYVQHFVLW